MEVTRQHPELPDGWDFELVLRRDDAGNVIRETADTPNTDPSQDQIEDASDVVVVYTEGGQERYRTIHGPFDSIDQIASYIDLEMDDDSPVY